MYDWGNLISNLDCSRKIDDSNHCTIACLVINEPNANYDRVGISVRGEDKRSSYTMCIFNETSTALPAAFYEW